MGKTNEFRKRLRKDAIERQRGFCFYCGAAMILGGVRDNHGLLATAEHLVKRSDGGSWSAGNIVAAHAVCNGRRGNRTVDEHKERYASRVPEMQYPAKAIFWCE